MTDKEISVAEVEKLEDRAEEAKAETQRAKKDMERLLRIFDLVGFSDFMEYLASPRKIIFWNLIAGIAKGLGIVIGMTVVVAVLVWFMTKMVDFPLIGEYFESFLDFLENTAPGSMP